VLKREGRNMDPEGIEELHPDALKGPDVFVRAPEKHPPKSKESEPIGPM
jgi:hypothetical protein